MMKKFSIFNFQFSKREGFTLVELVIVIGILLILFSLISVNLIGLQNRSSLQALTLTMINDLKEQQLKAMIGNIDSGVGVDSYGMYIEEDKYTLFKGTSYAANPSNYTVSFDPSIDVTNSPVTIIFSKGSGEIVGYDPLANHIDIIDGQGGSRVIEFNMVGAITDF